MNAEARKKGLLVITLVLVVAVLADQFGLLDRLSGGSGAGAGPLEAKSALLADQEALVAQRDAWERAAGEAEATLRRLGDRMIRARTAQLAENDLRDRAVREMNEVGLSGNPTYSSATPGAAREDGVRRIGIVLTFSTDDPAKVNRLVDQLENMSDLITSVERVKLVGPGQYPSRQTIDATITLMGLAMIDGSGGGEA